MTIDPKMNVVLVSWKIFGTGRSGNSILETRRMAAKGNGLGVYELGLFSSSATRLKVEKAFQTMEEAVLYAESSGIETERLPDLRSLSVFDSDELEGFMWWINREMIQEIRKNQRED